MSLPTLFLDAAPSSTLGLLQSFGVFIPILLIFYFFMIRPQSKKQKEMEKMLKALKKGDKVVTIGGIHGVVSSVKEDTVFVRVDENVRIEFKRSAIASVNPKVVPEGKSNEPDEGSSEK